MQKTGGRTYSTAPGRRNGLGLTPGQNGAWTHRTSTGETNTRGACVLVKAGRGCSSVGHSAPPTPLSVPTSRLAGKRLCGDSTSGLLHDGGLPANQPHLTERILALRFPAPGTPTRRQAIVGHLQAVDNATGLTDQSIGQNRCTFMFRWIVCASTCIELRCGSHQRATFLAHPPPTPDPSAAV